MLKNDGVIWRHVSCLGSTSASRINLTPKAFLTAMDAMDADMGAILRANENKLVAIVREGNRNTQARSDFNTAVAKALDRLLATPRGGN